MKAFILAAGHGTRLRPLTDTVPKCLLPIRGVPLLEIWLEQCERAGISEVLVNVHAHAEKVQEFVAQRRGGVRIRLAEEKELLGSAGTLEENRVFVAGEEAFYVLYGDVLTNVDLAALLEFHRAKKQAVTLGVHEIEDPRQCGVVVSDERGIVRSFVEKPECPRSNQVFSGVMVASQGIFDCTLAGRPADIGRHLLPQLVGRMAALPVGGYLQDIGTLDRYEDAQVSWPGLSERQTGKFARSRIANAVGSDF